MVLGTIPLGTPIDLDLPQLARLCSSEIKKCSAISLTTTSKFLGEVLRSFEKDVISSNNLSFSFDITEQINLMDIPDFLLSKSLFDCGEFLRCNNLLSSLIVPERGSRIPDVVYFFYVYSKYTYLNDKNSKSLMKITDLADYLLNIKDFSNSRSEEGLDELKEEMELTTKDHPYLLDSPYILYLLALVQFQLKYKESALKNLVACLKKNPLLWDAWSLLVNFIVDKEFLDQILAKFEGPTFFLKYFFESTVCIKIQEFERATERISSLAASGFAKNLHLQSQYALLLEKSRVILNSYQVFKKIFEKDPYFLEYSDVFSNILFVTENRVELSHLAHHCSQVDKFSAKTCCVIGNFYGLIGLHEKALDYFLRALKLQPTYPLVWMLIGHEYVELKQTKAAIRAYRECVKQNPHQYFAWYGLGQMYELLDIPLLAIRYYQEAYFLFPGDSRPLIALGDMYLKLGKSVDARRCFWKAFTIMDLESGSALLRLAKCFEQINIPIKVAASYTLFINFCDKFGRHSDADLAQAYRYLSEFHVNQKNYIDARIAANKCLQFDSVREEAKSLLSQITNLQLSNENDQIFDNQKPFTLFGIEVNQGLMEKCDTPLNKINPLKTVPIPLDVLHDMKWIDLEPLDIFCNDLRSDVNIFGDSNETKSPKKDDSAEGANVFSLDQITTKHRQLIEKMKSS